MEDKRIKLLNKLYPIEKLINNISTNILCPFHDDTLPSAHIYDNSIWCYGKCHRFYYPINLIKQKNLSIDKLYQELVDEYGEEKLNQEYEMIKDVVYKDKEYIIRNKNENFLEFCERYFI